MRYVCGCGNTVSIHGCIEIYECQFCIYNIIWPDNTTHFINDMRSDTRTKNAKQINRTCEINVYATRNIVKYSPVAECPVSHQFVGQRERHNEEAKEEIGHGQRCNEPILYVF